MKRDNFFAVENILAKIVARARADSVFAKKHDDIVAEAKKLLAKIQEERGELVE